MVVGPQDPALQRRRLRTELRRLRLDAGQTQRDVATAMEWHPSKVIRIENGTVGISVNDLKVLLLHYGVTAKRRVDEFLDMARAARTDPWSEFKDILSPEFLTYLDFEASAVTRRNYENTLVPGLLQTEEYARAILLGTYELSEKDVERHWKVRQRRQEIHQSDDPPRMWFILDEDVVRRRVGSPRTMRRQLEQLKEWGGADHITIWIIPFSAGAHPGMRGPFVLLEFAEDIDDDLVHLEQTTGELTTRDDPEETTQYLDRFYRLEELALSEPETYSLIDDAIDQLSVRKA